MTQQSNTGTADELTIKTARVFNAPPSLVYKAWSAPEHLAVWFGPVGFTNTFHEFDFVEGGKWIFTMHGPNGANYDNESHLVKLVQDTEIIYDHISPPVFRVRVLLEPVEDGKTKMHFSMHFNDAKTCNAVKGVVLVANEENMDRLTAELLNIK